MPSETKTMELDLYARETVQIQRISGMGGRNATFFQSFLKGPLVAY